MNKVIRVWTQENKEALAACFDQLGSAEGRHLKPNMGSLNRPCYQTPGNQPPGGCAENVQFSTHRLCISTSATCRFSPKNQQLEQY